MGVDLGRWGSEEDLGGVAREGEVIRLYCMEKAIFNLERLRKMKIFMRGENHQCIG